MEIKGQSDACSFEEINKGKLEEVALLNLKHGILGGAHGGFRPVLKVRWLGSGRVGLTRQMKKSVLLWLGSRRGGLKHQLKKFVLLSRAGEWRHVAAPISVRFFLRHCSDFSGLSQSPLHLISKAAFLLLADEGGVELAKGIITEETEEAETEGVTMEERVRLFAIIAKSLDTQSVTDLITKKTIGKGHVYDGLYILDAWVPHSVACSGVVSPFEAHYRLGHPSLPMLKKLCPQFHDVSSVDCESCHFAKHHRSSLSPRVNKRAEFAFELVHSDVWGPCPILSKIGFRYFVTFVDDFSRMTWIYFMKNRSEVFAHFSAFCVEIKTQFNVPVHILRSDNAKEYMSGSFQNYMNQHGILHQSSCADTPAQNGVAERKNRHLLETARALLFQMKVPKPFWADATFTACFLINRMSSTILNGDVPYSVLFPTNPLFPVEPRTFGSTCFVRDVRPHLTKLDPKALKCVFLGYSRLQKG
ncbi:hypothetical protein RJ640_008221 [Escallonia rubra]|uniref:Integrase catalytic domain-containing protein n=1 Tax=Escallonia rubra TaxID=112253 RepID=A0AA88TZ40_9ASTE|nr:hypothetical protein RJ640_008221 [Escallonia rubra]